MERISLDETYIEICRIVAKRSTCLKRKVGAVLVAEGRLISSGYNGAPRKIKNCCDSGVCIRENSNSGTNLQNCLAVHAEQNAIANAAYYGIKTENSTLYCTTKPCSFCAKLLINAGIKEVIYEEEYADAFGESLLNQAGVKLKRFIKDE